jgi:hypothetical protein
MLSMNIYSYIKAQNYEGFEINIVRKILIQLMQALLFLHHAHLFLFRKTSSTAISSPKMWCSNKSESQESNSSISVLPALPTIRSLPTYRAGTIDPQKLF